MNDSPFVGPRPFEKEDSDRFFGRTRETEELLSLIIAHRAVLVYSQSGAGKSSLLRAGVIKRLEEHVQAERETESVEEFFENINPG